MSQKINLTKLKVSALDPPLKGKRNYFYDTRVPGLVLSITSAGTKSFLVYRKVHGKPLRITLGRFPDLTVEHARGMAKKVIGEIAEGKNPNIEKRAKKAISVTLSEVFNDYISARKNLKPGTIFDYNRVMKEAFADWQNKPLASINKDMVEKRHTQLGEKSNARANNAMRVLRALFNFATGEYENTDGRSLFPENPVSRISHQRSWYQVERKKTRIKEHQLPAWFSAVMALTDGRSTGKSEVIRDYLMLILFTGLRRQEAARLKWSQIDFKDRTLTAIDTKNREDHVLPLSDFLYELLYELKKKSSSEFVFPGDGKGGFIVEPRRHMARVTDLSGVEFTLHDLRRTFITIAESIDISAYALKRLLNHKINHLDITSGYIIIDVERLRQPIQKIADYILKAASVKQSAEIHDLKIKKVNAVLPSLG